MNKVYKGDFFFSFNLQADTSSDSHSLHITLSTYQKNAWIDFMEKVCIGRVVMP